MQKKYCMGDGSFTEAEYYSKVETMLFNCRGVESLRLNLPFQLVGRHCNTAIRVLANTLKAFACRAIEGAVDLKTLVVENLTDIAVCATWLNPSDVVNIVSITNELRHLVLSLRRHDLEPARATLFRSCFWDLIERATELETLCIVGMDHDDRAPRGLKQTRFWQLPVEEWRARAFPAPRVNWCSLVCLELKRLEITPEAFHSVLLCLGNHLRELYLNEIYLKTEQSNDYNQDSRKALWVGLPNQRPGPDCYWMATLVRTCVPSLRICRASFLAYDHFYRDDTTAHPDFDLGDPCGLGRSVSQRFVEVALGIRQPNSRSGRPVVYLSGHPADDAVLAQGLRDRTRALLATEYDTVAYQTAVDNPTSEWQRSLDGIFHNCNTGTLDELHHIAETACRGMNEINRRRNESTAGHSTASSVFEDEPEDGADSQPAAPSQLLQSNHPPPNSGPHDDLPQDPML